MKIKPMQVIIGLGVLSGGYLTYAIASAIMNRVKDNGANAFLEELMKCLLPASAGMSQSKAFDPHYWKTAHSNSGGRAVLLAPEEAERLAKQISSARGGLWGWANDDEKAIYAVYGSVQDKAQASQVAEAFQNIPGKGRLSDELDDWLSTSEVAHIMSLVNRMPDYRT